MGPGIPGYTVSAGGAPGMISFARAQTCAHETTGSLMENCGLTTSFLDSTMVAWFYGIGPWFVSLFWAVVVFVVWIRYRNAMLSLLVGTTLALGGAVAIPDAAVPLIVALVGTALATSLYMTLARVRGK